MSLLTALQNMHLKTDALNIQAYCARNQSTTYTVTNTASGLKITETRVREAVNYLRQKKRAEWCEPPLNFIFASEQETLDYSLEINQTTFKLF